jgi:hypothetical protein
MVVNISRNMATRTLAIFSLTYEEADPLEVAMILAIPQAIASFTGIPKKTRIGIRMLAPPSPVRAPRKPTGMERKSNETILSMEKPWGSIRKNFVFSIFEEPV